MTRLAETLTWTIWCKNAHRRSRHLMCCHCSNTEQHRKWRSPSKIYPTTVTSFVSPSFSLSQSVCKHVYIYTYIHMSPVACQGPPPMVWSPSSNSTTLVLLLVILLVVVLLVVLLPLLLLHSTNTTSIITTTCTSASTMGGYHRMGVGATRRCIIYIFIYTHTHHFLKYVFHQSVKYLIPSAACPIF